MRDISEQPAYFSIVQYVPNPIADERINIGVVVVGDGNIESRFITRWERAKSFGQEDVSFLKDFADSITRSSKPQLRFDVDARELHWNKELLEKYTNSWANSIQLTTPRAALRSPNDLLNEIADKFLRGSQWREPKAVNDRRAAVHLGKLTMRDELRQRGIRDIKNIMKTNFEIKGKFSSHAFDFCIANGKMYSAVQGLSFQGTDPKVKQKDADATAWAVDDVKKRKPTLPIAVIVVPPRGTSKAYENARSTFLGLGASFFDDKNDIRNWAARVAAQVARSPVLR